jgi:hypothetical protein
MCPLIRGRSRRLVVQTLVGNTQIERKRLLVAVLTEERKVLRTFGSRRPIDFVCEGVCRVREGDSELQTDQQLWQ